MIAICARNAHRNICWRREPLSRAGRKKILPLSQGGRGQFRKKSEVPPAPQSGDHDWASTGRSYSGQSRAYKTRPPLAAGRYFKRPARCAELFNPFVGANPWAGARADASPDMRLKSARLASSDQSSAFSGHTFMMIPARHRRPSASPAGAGAGGCVGTANDWRRAPRADLDAKLAQRFRRRASGPEIGRDLQLDERACANPSIDAIPALKAGRDAGNFACRLGRGQHFCWFARTVRRKACPPTRRS